MPVPSPDKHRGKLGLESTICMHVKCNYFTEPLMTIIRTLRIRVLHKFQNTIFCSHTANTSNLHITIDLETRQTNLSSNFRKKKILPLKWPLVHILLCGNCTQMYYYHVYNCNTGRSSHCYTV